jgi:integrase/recombinase XerD
MKPKIILKPGKHRRQEVVFIIFQKDEGLITLLKNFGNVRWSASKRVWYILRTDFGLSVFFDAFQQHAWIDYSLIKSSTSPKVLDSQSRQKIEEFGLWMQHKRYSPSTIRTYKNAIGSFLLFTQPRPLTEINNDDMVRYVNEIIIAQKLSFSYQNQVVNAVRLFYSEVMKSAIDIEKLERPRREYRLPNILSREEVGTILKVKKNLKHRAVLTLIYACGLRRGELLNLKPADVDSKRGLLIIRQAKGRKDRVAPLPEKIIEILREYYLEYRPVNWLFEGQVKGKKYSAQSLQKALKKTLLLAKIKKPVTLHWLRHSYATHLLESGTDLRFIQEILGHKSSRTTEIYTHVSTSQLGKIKSPIDDLDID